jgi:hypothetical protein
MSACKTVYYISGQADAQNFLCKLLFASEDGLLIRVSGCILEFRVWSLEGINKHLLVCSENVQNNSVGLLAGRSVHEREVQIWRKCFVLRIVQIIIIHFNAALKIPQPHWVRPPTVRWKFNFQHSTRLNEIRPYWGFKFYT